MEKLRAYQSILFNAVIILFYTLTILFITGLSTDAKMYIDNINSYLTIYISLYLLWRFNPFSKIKFDDFDKRVIFTSGFYLFATTVISKTLIHYILKIKKYFDKLITYSTSLSKNSVK
jgi:hypothetical protein